MRSAPTTTGMLKPGPERSSSSPSSSSSASSRDLRPAGGSPEPVATETGPERSRNTAGASAEPPYVLPGGREASRDPGPVTEDDEEEGVSLAMLEDSTAATPAVLPGAAINGLAAAAVPP